MCLSCRTSQKLCFRCLNTFQAAERLGYRFSEEFTLNIQENSLLAFLFTISVIGKVDLIKYAFSFSPVNFIERDVKCNFCALKTEGSVYRECFETQICFETFFFSFFALLRLCCIKWERETLKATLFTVFFIYMCIYCRIFFYHDGMLLCWENWEVSSAIF